MFSRVAQLLRRLPWSNTRQAWLERLSPAGVALAAVGLVAFSGVLDLWVQALAWVALVLVAAVLFRAGGIKVFGPIFLYDLLRTARRTRTYVIRSGYLLFLLLVLWLMYLSAWPHDHSGRRLLNSEIARFAQTFFWTFLAAQFFLLLLLTPAFTAGAIADERQRETIQYILITDLRNHEIVLGKLAARLAHLGGLLLAGLPILGVVQFLGGVDPHLVLAGFGGTVLMMTSTAGVSILASVVARPSRNAIILAYFAVLLYAGACLLSFGLLAWFSPGSLGGRAPRYELLEDANAVVQAGNPVVCVYSILNSSDTVEAALVRHVGAFALFHGLVAAASIATAVVVLRKAALREPRPPAVSTPGRSPRRPAVGDAPMLWKEVVSERLRSGGWVALILMGLLIAASFLWPFLTLVGIYSAYRVTWEEVAVGMNVWVRVMSTVLGCLALVGVPIRAAYSIGGERSRDTLDSLLTSPLSSEAILFGKWLGGVLSARWFVLWLGVVWVLGVLTGGLSPAAVPLLLLAWLVYAAAAASLGLWFSLVSRSPLHAVMYTLLAGLGLSFGHWLLLWCCALTARFSSESPGMAAVSMALGFEVGLTPQAGLAVLAFRTRELEILNFSDGKFGYAVVGFAVGIAIWGAFAVFVWMQTNRRFKRDYNRL